MQNNQTLESPPEVQFAGVSRWLKENLFSSLSSSILTILSIGAVVGVFRAIIGFFISPEREWTAVTYNLQLYMVQAYPESDFIRVWITVGLLIFLLGLSWGFNSLKEKVSIKEWCDGLLKGISSFLFIILITPTNVDVEGTTVEVFKNNTRIICLAIGMGLIIGVYLLRKTSPKSEIVIELTDENQYLMLNDTSDYSVYIKTPNGPEKRVYFYENNQERMQFIPASLPKNNSKIILQGDFPIDGKYQLRVQASDRTDNNSGDIDYTIGFEVINKSTITNIVNYPNPFTTSTRFVFTLTGSEIPEMFKIQIMTITGKVVREIHKDELGPIHIGRNISDFAWDGTDTYGDRLANGVYLYHVITKINSQDVEHRDTSADSFFKKGFGKMYLFR